MNTKIIALLMLSVLSNVSAVNLKQSQTTHVRTHDDTGECETCAMDVSADLKSFNDSLATMNVPTAG